ncbi:thiosulfate oxidation carrier protein SoxY [Methylomonas sp. AM2-LC]|uniref:thiosulfate oxidation carrier protein SoxY n=1 Tax=Methylomonas sp. AM2-LC TaxID=3153301 RepID=UPI003265F744
MPRRLFLKQCMLTVLGWCASKSAVSAWDAGRFSASPYTDILHQLVKQQTLIDSNDMQISLPDIAENGAVVPISIRSDLDNIQQIYVLVEKNPTPLAAQFSLSARVAVQINARIKMAESCNVVVIAQQGDRYLRSQQWVKVSVGGCGTG